MYKEDVIVSESKLVFCAGVNINGIVEHAKDLATTLFEKYKNEINREYDVTFIETTPITNNYNTMVLSNNSPKIVLHIMTGDPDNDLDFVIEVNIIFGICDYKFDMRWKVEK